jgi:hypothetical protein
MHSAIDSEGDQVRADALEKIHVLGGRHFAGGHRELAMPGTPETGSVAMDRHVVGGIGEYDLRLLDAHEPFERSSVSGVAAEEPVSTELPQIPELRDGRAVHYKRGDFVGGIRPLPLTLLDDEIDLRGVEAGNLDGKIEIHLGQRLQLFRQQVGIPRCQLGESVIGQSIGPFLRFTEVLDPNAGDSGKTEGLRRLDPSMTGDDLAVGADQRRNDEAERRDTRRQLLELSRRVLAGISRIGLQAVGVELLYPELRTLPGWWWLGRSRHGAFIPLSSIKYRKIGAVTETRPRGAGPVVR